MTSANLDYGDGEGRLLNAALEWELGRSARPQNQAASSWDWRALLVNAAVAAGLLALVVLVWQRGPGGGPSDGPDFALPVFDLELFQEKPEAYEIWSAIDLYELPPQTSLKVQNADADLLARVVASQPELVSLHLSGPALRDEDLAVLAKLPRLRRLSLARCDRLTDESMPHIGRLTELESLDLTGFVGQTASIGGSLPADYVDPGSKLTPSSMREVAKLRKLRRLILFGVSVGDAGMEILADAGMPELRELNLDYSGVESEGIKQLASFPRLQSLSIESLMTLRDADLARIAKHKGLRRLSVGGNGFTSAYFTERGLASVAKLENLEVLTLAHWGKLESRHYRMLTRLEKLESLTIQGCANFDADALSYFAPMTTLKSLSLHWLGGLTNEDLAVIYPRQLETLDLSGSLGDFTERVLEQAAAAMPNCRIFGFDGDLYDPRFIRSYVHSAGTGLSDATVLILDSAGRYVGRAQSRRIQGRHLNDYQGPRPALAEGESFTIYDSPVLPSGSYELVVMSQGCEPLRVQAEVVDKRADHIIELGVAMGKAWLNPWSPDEVYECPIALEVWDRDQRTRRDAHVLLMSGGRLRGKLGLTYSAGALFYAESPRIPDGKHELLVCLPGYTIATMPFEASGGEPQERLTLKFD